GAAPGPPRAHPPAPPCRRRGRPAASPPGRRLPIRSPVSPLSPRRAGRTAGAALVATAVGHRELAAVGTARSVRLRAEHATGTSGDRRACRVGHRWESACRVLALYETDRRSLPAREKTGGDATDGVSHQRLRPRD